MDPVTRRAADAELRAFAKTYFDLSAPVQPLPGEVDLNYRVGDAAVLKLSAPGTAPAELDFQAAVLARLAASDFPLATPRPLSTCDGAPYARVTSGGEARLLRAQTWVAGRPLHTVRYRSPDLLAAWGDACAQLAEALRGFDHPGAHRYYAWDLRRAGDARARLPHLRSAEERALVGHFLALYTGACAPTVLDALPQAVCHNDAHEDNLLVDGPAHTPRLAGLIDVGDAVWTVAVSELAVACAYAGMDQVDPLTAIAQVVAGYTARRPLLDAELAVLFPLVCARLITSLTTAAENRSRHPDNAYLSVSEAQAWAVLRALQGVHPRLAHYRLRAAAGRVGLPGRETSAAVDPGCVTLGPSGLPTGEHPVVRAAAPVALDLSLGSPTLGTYADYSDLERLGRGVTRAVEDAGADFGIGGYLETRPFYTTDHFAEPGNEGPRWRTLHLGLDVWGPAGTPVYAPLAGRVHSLRDNGMGLDYGPAVILEHALPDGGSDGGGDGQTFYTLYGHLSRSSLGALVPGQRVAAGACIATFGAADENGGWPPHLHFQVVRDLLDYTGDFPGVAFHAERATWAALCPNPYALAGFALPTPEGSYSSHPVRSPGISHPARSPRLSPSLSLSYRHPLTILRGAGAYLLDHTGRRFLDTVNNVAHVGHEHPAVVAALQGQAAVLNTNTRYLHPGIIAFAEELLATFPPALCVAHFVNSGSEANELALRLARAATGERPDVIAVEVGYHGNTGGTIAVSSYKFDGRGGEGAPHTTRVVPLPDVYAGRHRDPATAGADYAAYVDAAIADLHARGRAPAAFLAESILSCGGQVVLPEGYLAQAYASVRAAGGVCIADEVQTGLGRVGTHWWAFEGQGVVPDIVTVGKPLGNGHPLAAVVCTHSVSEAFAGTGMEYFNTFGGNPVSCAVGRAVLRVVREEGLRQNARDTGAYLRAGFRSLATRHPLIGDVRGEGLFLGLELVRDGDPDAPAAAEADHLVNRLRERGILASTDGPRHNVLKVKPPLVFARTEADRLLSELDRTLHDISDSPGL